jgi:hypothetical protein
VKRCLKRIRAAFLNKILSSPLLFLLPARAGKDRLAKKSSARRFLVSPLPWKSRPAWMRNRVKLVFTILLSLLFLGCGGGVNSLPPTPNASAIQSAPILTNITLTPATASIQVGEEQPFVAQGLDQYRHPMTGITFTWTSSDDAGNGGAIALFHGGEATGVSAGVMHVTASASGINSAPAMLTVFQFKPSDRTATVSTF